MKISEIIKESSVITKIKPQSKRALLESVAEIAGEKTGIDKRTIFDALLERENLGSTGFGSKTAIPHARISGLNEVFVMFIALENPINFNSVDGSPVDLLFLLLSPENNGADHLTALAAVSRVLKNETLCNKLRKANDPIEIYSLLKNEETI